MKTKEDISHGHNCFDKSLFLLVAVFLVFSAISAKAEMLSIKGDNVHLRSGPGKKYSVKWEYGAGFPVKVVGRKGDWLKVKDFEGDTGWVHKSLLTSHPHMIVKANKINIRKGPGSKNKIVGMAYYGVVFETLQHQSGWVEVQHDSGLTGWISSTFLWGF
jgi:SH3-like domain-containing protein